MVEKILNNTIPYGKIRASHEGSLHSSTLNRDKYQNFSGIQTRVMNSLAIVANALTTGLFLTCHAKLLIHKVFMVGY